MTAPPDGRTKFRFLIAAAAAAGTVLRLWMLPGQILLDDEWHGLNQVAGASLADVLTDFDAKDNTSLPLNVYHWALLHTAGWTELSVRLPVILAGILGLVAMPLAARRIVGDRGAVFFAFLLAASPFAIFYARFSRAYAVILLLCFLTVVSACRWLSTGERRHKRLFGIFGILGAYTHPLAAISLAVPFVLYLAGLARTRRPKAPEAGGIAVGIAEVRRTGLVVAGLLVPLAWAMLTAEERLPWGQGEWSMSGLRDAATLLAGTVNVPLAIAFLAALAWGFAALWRTNPVVARAIVATAALYAAMLAVTRPLGLGTGVVVLRYAIVLLPLSLVAVAAGFDAIARAIETRVAGAAAGSGPMAGIGPARGAVSRAILPAAPFAAFVIFVVLLGPLPHIYASPNNFTNHSAYQGSYDPPDDSRSDARHVYPGHRITKEDVPAFYRDLAATPGDGTVVEYPFDITNYNNLFWFYQRVHRKEVVAGYCPDGSILGYRADLPPGNGNAQPRLGLLSADQILSHVADRSALAFRNMVDMTDPSAVGRSGADHVILHKYVMALRFLPGGTTGAVPVYYKSVPAIAAGFRRAYGPPVWEDGAMVCFRIGKP